LFRKHYPIRPLYFVGLALYVVRYVGLYALQRLIARRAAGG